MDLLTTEMMEHVCDKLCKYPDKANQSEDELEEICADCEMGRFVCDILNQYNKINNFDKAQSTKLLKKCFELERELDAFKSTGFAPEEITSLKRMSKEKRCGFEEKECTEKCIHFKTCIRNPRRKKSKQ